MFLYVWKFKKVSEEEKTFQKNSDFFNMTIRRDLRKDAYIGTYLQTVHRYTVQFWNKIVLWMQTLWWGFEVTAHFDLLCFNIVHSGLFFPCTPVSVSLHMYFCYGKCMKCTNMKGDSVILYICPKVSQAKIPNLMPWNCLHRALYYNLILTLPKYIWRPLHTQIVFFLFTIKASFTHSIPIFADRLIEMGKFQTQSVGKQR
jgi:hypothetical protein